MVQHAAALDQIEAPLERAQREDVGLAELDVVEAPRLHATPRGGEAAPRQVDGQHLGAGVARRGGQRLLSGAAPGHEHARLRERREAGDVRQQGSDDPIERLGLIVLDLLVGVAAVAFGAEWLRR